ncbi:DUF58 domain-containing protein [Candidatus Bipolaricaulota bacterium]|jgi:uncharacterized protein (DUF58 family)|nr:DUF58 domain-containing protein [Candidatus Bipolaricaulota bacterium]TFH10328.1 MAG: DUF58 domain-containing protein [Candidatus Atribacteria bacterium]
MKNLIDETFLSRLANLRFMTRGRQKGRLSGIHASRRTGVSLEFADYRPYTPGDDFRYVDWKVYGRLGRIVVKSFVHESDLPVYLLIDLSSSMSLGSPSKAHYAAQLCAALAYLGLKSHDRVGIYSFSNRILTPVSPRHGMSQMNRILTYLADVEPTGETSINDAIEQFLQMTRESGLVVLVSDFLSQQDCQQGLNRLLHRGDEVVAIQVLDQEELTPTSSGKTRFVEVETGRNVTLAVGQQTLQEYETRLAQYQRELADVMHRRSILHFVVPTTRSLSALFHEEFRARGFLR